MRHAATLTLFVVSACSGPAKPAPEQVQPAVSVRQPEPDQEPPAVAKPAVNAAPDVPTGAAAARDAELAAIAQRYVDAFVNTQPAFTRDGKRVIFVSNRDGLPQLYLGDVAQPTATPMRLATTTERVTGPLPTPDGKAVVFRADTGADENWSIFRVGLDGNPLVELTPGEKLQREQPRIPDGKPDTMFFAARKMSEAKSTIYSASAIAASEPTPLWSDELPAYLDDVSRDGKRLVVRRYPSRSDNYVLVVDVATGKDRVIYPPAGTKVAVMDSRISPDGKIVYIASDGGAEKAQVIAIDAKSGKTIATHELNPPTAQILHLSVAKKGGLIAVSALVGEHTEIRLLDGAKLKPRAAVAMPLGQGTASEFSEDGKRLGVQWSTPMTPGEIYALDAKSGAFSLLRSEPRPTLATMPGLDVTVHKVAAFDGGTIPTNVYMPEGALGSKYPVIVSYHGGPSGTSVIRWNATTAYFLSLGYIVVEPNVRGSGGFGRAFEEGDNGRKRLDAFKDIESSARWVAKQPWADPDRLVVFGGSYGGYTVMIALALWPDIWRAGVNLFGVINLETFMASTSGVIRKIFLVEFGDPAQDAAFLAEISPITDVGKVVDPTFVYAGANDPRVPRSESDLVVKALRGKGIQTEYMVADNEGHSLARTSTQIEFMSRSARFLETALK